ncbi:LysM peptidoglycan-binding domain-containing protein [Geobacillus sp. B4113_201601]|uniref:LysM peptidoglycan-binding domain-containing protein n=1 Tax=Geobacillus sp. B4113_201601 TaxID=1586290 RepID=UPI000780BB37|nr:glycoside hydrolase family 18 protein [Geobacillus sp. B4113_201601]KYD27999.1 hypothetical protein B4113_4076 [Geobacillus sp. B4113_201601]
MFSHTVQPGDSLFSIGRRYDYSVEDLRIVNGLTASNIVPGQALLIPLYTYTVQPGDTLTAIARRAFVTLEQLQAANPHLQPNALRPGMKITIPNISWYQATTLGYYVVREPSADRTMIRNFAPYSSYITLFEYHFAPNGDVVNELDDVAAVREAWRNRVTPLVAITNLTTQGFSPILASRVLNNPEARTNLIENIFYLVSRKGYGGVNIDFEQIRGEDRDLFTGFLRQLRDRLKPAGYVVTIAVPAKTSENIPWLQGYDYGGIGAVVDYMFIMAYDWHHLASEPGPVAPIGGVRAALQFAVERVPRQKILLGLPLYGYDWVIPYRLGTIAKARSNQEAIHTAMRYQSFVQYSLADESPFFQYTDELGNVHEVWFEDIRSMGQKMKLAWQFQLAGVGAWQLTLRFAPGSWLLRKFFTIRKV